MKRQILSAFMLIGFICAVTCATEAQVLRRLVVDVPFDFVVGKKVMPAGTYIVKQWLSDNNKIILVQSADGRRAMTARTIPVEQRAATADTARLDFRRYSDKYFLACVWSPGERAGRELPRTQFERSFMREFVRDAKQPDVVATLDAQPQIVSVNGRLR